MKVTIQLFGQLSAALGGACHEVEVSEGATVQDALRVLMDRHDELAPLVLSSAGELAPSVLLFKGDDQIAWSDPAPLKDGQEVVVATAIAGG